MVERVHLGILEALVVCPTIPAFPDRRPALCDGIEPGWPSGLFEQCIGNLQMPGLAQNPVDEGRADESGA